MDYEYENKRLISMRLDSLNKLNQIASSVEPLDIGIDELKAERLVERYGTDADEIITAGQKILHEHINAFKELAK